jgi:hypothetical protein
MAGIPLVRAQDLGPQHRLVEVQLPVEFLHRGRVGLQVDDGVDALGMFVDLVGHPAPAPHVDLLDGAAVLLHDRQEGVERRCDRPLFQGGVEDDHDFVMAHERAIPPVG